MAKRIEAAVAVLRDGDSVLLQRRRRAPCAGQWEFPGGKINSGEKPADALRRELAEEVGVSARAVDPWLTVRHRYPHGDAVLHFFRVGGWTGNPAGMEGQVLSWRDIRRPPPRGLLAANRRPWQWLGLPSRCGISAAQQYGAGDFLRRLKTALAGGLRLVVLRDKTLPPRRREALGVRVAALCRESGALFIVADDAALARRLSADGVHLSSASLIRAARRPRFGWVGASVHDDAELQKAAALGLDYAFLSPVRKTASHPSAAPLGWRGFAALARSRPFPIFALGGLTAADASAARRHSAHGIAAVSDAWR